MFFANSAVVGVLISEVVGVFVAFNEGVGVTKASGGEVGSDTGMGVEVVVGVITIWAERVVGAVVYVGVGLEDGVVVISGLCEGISVGVGLGCVGVCVGAGVAIGVGDEDGAKA